MLLAHGEGAVFDFHAHPDVWLLIAVLVGGYFALIRFVGPGRAADDEPVVTLRQKVSYLAGVAVLWIGADWPMHELGENFLFSMHMTQHTLFSLVAPPLILMGMPKWMLRIPLQKTAALKVARAMTRPIVGLVLFNAVIVLTHWPALVNLSLRSELAHFAIHVVLVGSSIVMWWPVIDRLPELSRMSPPGKMLYLFLQSIVPTVPASFLTFSDGVLYDAYAEFPRLWNLSVITDQQIAGLIMKVAGGLLLWLAIAILFFRWSSAEEHRRAAEVSWDDFERELQALELRRT